MTVVYDKSDTNKSQIMYAKTSDEHYSTTSSNSKGCIFTNAQIKIKVYLILNIILVPLINIFSVLHLWEYYQNIK